MNLTELYKSLKSGDRIVRAAVGFKLVRTDGQEEPCPEALLQKVIAHPTFELTIYGNLAEEPSDA